MTKKTKASECPFRSITIVHLTPGDFETAKLDGFRPAELPYGVLAVEAKGSRSATAALTSAPLKMAMPFNQVLAGANAALGPDDRLELAVQVKGKKGWGPWFEFGSFSPAGGSASVKGRETPFGKMETDTLTLPEEARLLRYRVTLKAAARSKAFLRLVSLTCTNTAAPYDEALAVRKPASFTPVRLDVTRISQMTQPAPNAKDICSPTSVTMILNHFGLKARALTTADRVFDGAGKIYGNWTLNTMYAGSKGLYSWPARLNSLEEARKYLAAGIPLAASVTFGPDELKGSPIKKTRGHLMVLKGFDARGRVLANDPAAPAERTVERAYDRKEFARAWLKNKYGTAYVIAPLELLPLTARAPLAELFSKPLDLKKDDKSMHIESQLLPLENVSFVAARGAWLKVAAHEQPHKADLEQKNFHPYSGWMEARRAAFLPLLEPDAVVRVKRTPLKDGPHSELSMGARVRILGREKGALARIMLPGGDAALIGEKDLNLIQVKLKAGKLRKKIMKTARQFLGDKYYWGGRSGYGVDCSGLVNISYRVWGLELPRNAAQQCDYGRPVTRRNFKPADLIFSTKRDHPERINHVMLYAGGEKLLEATQDSGSVREVTFKKKFGQELAKTKDGQMVGDRRIFFRTVLG